MKAKNTVLITGAGRESGLGMETARQLAALGHRVIISARSYKKAVAIATILQAENGDVTPLELDITSDASVAQAVQQLTTQFGHLDVLINNAADMTGITNTIEDADLEAVTAAFDITLIGTWRVTRAMLPLLKHSTHPRIVNVTSGMGSLEDPIFGLHHYPGAIGSYALTKLVQNGLTIKTAKDLQADGIQVNAVCPGFTATYPGMEEKGARPIPVSAKGIVWVALLPKDGPSGSFFRDEQLLPW